VEWSKAGELPSIWRGCFRRGVIATVKRRLR
jgi:hypothetical protein